MNITHDLFDSSALKFHRPDTKENDSAEYGLRPRSFPESPNFATQNKTKRCYSAYTIIWSMVDQGVKPDNLQFKYVNETMRGTCPEAWIATWDEQRVNGIFPGFRNRAGSLSSECENLEEAITRLSSE
eukprot:CAMPEP_0201487490 /NCGR_PEP_ID=MMETSP0151_2-20130828/13689_1 /ASSEMBLY_ACC=CAM_ASM_000257 /TAXON_ID=200890 /ORGANISM="Paramoeba atlantica, Strain 621/1 / CCAP 1560/9" /LENGTH=127 /DNA_ID=CAMNT_0047872537 /DNA_START=60 /DNA_END=443 /DNA_ORIENTATION=+